MVAGLQAALELQRAIYAGEPLYRVGFEAYSIAQVERALAAGQLTESDARRWLRSAQLALLVRRTQALELASGDRFAAQGDQK